MKFLRSWVLCNIQPVRPISISLMSSNFHQKTCFISCIIIKGGVYFYLWFWESGVSISLTSVISRDTLRSIERDENCNVTFQFAGIHQVESFLLYKHISQVYMSRLFMLSCWFCMIVQKRSGTEVLTTKESDEQEMK